MKEITRGELLTEQEHALSILDDFEHREYVPNDSKEYLTSEELSMASGQSVKSVQNAIAIGMRKGIYVFKWKRSANGRPVKAYRKVQP